METNTNIDSKNLGELLERYYQKKLTNKELQELESMKEHDEFLKDAMEGFDQFPDAISSIPKYKSNNKTYAWITLSALAILTISSIYFLNSPESENKSTTVSQVVIPEEFEEEIVEVVKPITIEKEIKVPVTKIKTKKEKEILNTKKTIPEREFFEIPKMKLNPLEIKQKTDYTIKKAKTKSLLYHNFLAIDYSVIYTNSIPLKQEYSGTDASKANEEEKGVETSSGSQQLIISYKEQLKRSLFQLKEKNYTRAIENFEIILTHFPHDANAEFYIGYALYYQKRYKNAIPYFDKAMTNAFDFFFEDAEWFKANSLEKMGNIKEAHKLYKKIKTDGGYYSYQL